MRVVGEYQKVKPVVRHPFSRLRVLTVNVGESLTHQSHAESCDVNNIISRYDRTGVLPLPSREPQYGDVTGLQGELTTLLGESERVIRATGEFAAGWKPPQPVEAPIVSSPVSDPPDPVVVP